MLHRGVIMAETIDAGWFIFEVGEQSDGPGWVALLTDVEPDQILTGEYPTQLRWLELGEHPSRDAAWALAEQLIATRH